MKTVPRRLPLKGLGAIIVGLGGLSVATIRTVPAGHVGVKDFFGTVADEHLQPGLHIVKPFTRVHKFSLQTRLAVEECAVPSAEGLTVGLDVGVLFRVDPPNVVNLYKTVGKNFQQVLLQSQLRSGVRDVTSAYPAKALYTAGEREQMYAQIRGLLKSKLGPHGILIDDILFRRVTLPPGLTQAIELKLNAEQESQAMEFKIQREKQEAERKTIEAQGIASFQATVSKGITRETLLWKALEATSKFADSPNTKIVVIGSDKNGGCPVLVDWSGAKTNS